jgi:hypothetical protein
MLSLREKKMHPLKRSFGAFVLAAIAVGVPSALSQTSGEKASFTATAVANNELGSGVGTVYIDITRWSTEPERTELVNALEKNGPPALLEELRDMRPTGSIRTPDSLAYELRYAHQTPIAEGGRRIVLVTDRPMSFWEAHTRPRTVNYPFTVIQMEIGRDGKGTGTMSYATRITGGNRVIELESFATSPIMLTQIQARKPSN